MSDTSRAFICVFVSSFASLIVGFHVGAGITDGAVKYVKELKSSRNNVEMTTVIISLSSLIGTIIAGRASEKIGRRPGIILGMTIFLFGRLLMTSIAQNYVMLLLGHFFASVGVGCVLVIIPVYVVEVSPAASRGKLASITEFFSSFGKLLGCMAEYGLPRVDLDAGWRFSLFVGTVLSALLALGILALPESPAWLNEVKIAAGAEAILNNPLVISKVSSTDFDLKKLRTVLIEIIETFSILFTIFLLDRLGRRLLLLISVAGMSVSLVALGIFLGRLENNADAMVILCAVSYLMFFSVGLSPITTVYISEAFPIGLRVWGSAITVATNKGLNYASSALFLWLCKLIGFRGSLFSLATLTAGMWLLCYIMLPETGGKILETIGPIFGGYTIRRSAAASANNRPI